MKIKVGGMRCSSCAKSIEEALGKIPGVLDTEVNLENKIVTVKIKDSSVLEKVLKDKIEDLGFDIL